jgi:nicotinate-nucleotide adenylyltransferase
LLALYGGSFDPPHSGHVRVALKALDVLDIDKLIIVPNFRNPFKSSACAEGAVRIQWLQQIFEPYEKIEISDFEVNLHRSVPTIETVEHYAPDNKKLYLIIGADNLPSLKQWYNYEKLAQKVIFVVAKRDNITIPEGMITLDINEERRSTHFRDQYSPLGLEETLEKDIITYHKEHHEPKN